MAHTAKRYLGSFPSARDVGLPGACLSRLQAGEPPSRLSVWHVAIAPVLLRQAWPSSSIGEVVSLRRIIGWLAIFAVYPPRLPFWDGSDGQVRYAAS